MPEPFAPSLPSMSYALLCHVLAPPTVWFSPLIFVSVGPNIHPPVSLLSCPYSPFVSQLVPCSLSATESSLVLHDKSGSIPSHARPVVFAANYHLRFCSMAYCICAALLSSGYLFPPLRLNSFSPRASLPFICPLLSPSPTLLPLVVRPVTSLLLSCSFASSPFPLLLRLFSVLSPQDLNLALRSILCLGPVSPVSCISFASFRF